MRKEGALEGNQKDQGAKKATARHEKSRKHASIAYGHFFGKLWTFLDKLHICGEDSNEYHKSFS